MASKYLFIINPVSNRGKAARLLPAIERLLAGHHIEHDYVTTQQAGQAMALACDKAFEYDVIVAVGGDGTVHEVTNGLMQARGSNHHLQTPASLGIVPIGSGNDFVKMVGLHKDIEEAVNSLANNRFIPLDVGELIVDKNPVRYFMNNVGIGFDAFVNAESLKIRFLKGLSMYLVAAIKSIYRYQHPYVEVEANGQVHAEKVLLVNVGNGRCSGGGFYLTPDAEINDGLLDICIIRSLSRRGILSKLPKTFSGAHRNMPDVKLFRTAEICIRSNEGLPIHADGEVISLQAREVQIRIIPSALRVMEAVQGAS